MLVLRSLFFALILPGSVTLLIPYFILSTRGGIAVPRWGLVQYLAALVIAAGAAWRC